MSDNYASLKEKLDEECTFPMKYMYKFIVPKDKVQEVLPHFETAEISTKRSKTGKYVSVSALVMAFSSDDIISKYKSMGNIEGMISL
ncbi:MAG: putative lipoic acid-binding regulatory protein [Saprospiraceae bacterium]|jgi:putative lipoic acid-binding regulatory protein